VPRYWIDASVWIEAHLRSYPIGIADSFWKWVAGQVECGNIVSPRRVYQEVAEHEKHKDDELAKWVRHRRERGLCIPPSRSVQDRIHDIGEHIFTKYLVVEAWDFQKGADPWIVAHALEDHGIVVTKESETRPNAQKVRIPDVCDHFNVKCIDTLEMLKQLKARF
jgi:hypothetical protein